MPILVRPKLKGLDLSTLLIAVSSEKIASGENNSVAIPVARDYIRDSKREERKADMLKEFVVDYTDWRGHRDTLLCYAGDEVRARAQAYWILGDLIEIHSLVACADND